jgi:hypothetical protein
MSVQRFVSNYGLQAIDFLKIDTQGTDLFILHEFLKHATVKAGVVEVYSSEIESEQMYLESRNTFRELCRILDSMGRYKIQKVIPAESTCKELNVFFFNCAYTNAENIISILQIEKSPTFGKFWQILGVGFGKTTAKPLPKIFARKILIGMRTPKKSLKSLLRRITA